MSDSPGGRKVVNAHTTLFLPYDRRAQSSPR